MNDQADSVNNSTGSEQTNGQRQDSSDASITDSLRHPPSIVYVILFIIALAAIVAFIVCWINGAHERTASQSTPTPTPGGVVCYTSDLYRFSTTYTASTDSPMEYAEVSGDCNGLIFSPKRISLHPYAIDYPQLRICYRSDAPASPHRSPKDDLKARAEQIVNSQFTDGRVGLIKTCELGADKIPGFEVYIRGTDVENNREIKWYEAMVNFEGRIYAVEVATLDHEWDTYWPGFRQMIDSLEFESGVIRPASTPIVIP